MASAKSAKKKVKLVVLGEIRGVIESPRRYSKHLTEVVSKVEFDCLACGACCMPPKDGDEPPVGWTDVQPHDVARLTRNEFAKHVVRDANGVDSKPDFVISLVNHEVDGLRCSFLGGTVGKRAPCKIYLRRPETCSAFTMGSRACLDARRSAGFSTKEDVRDE